MQTTGASAACCGLMTSSCFYISTLAPVVKPVISRLPLRRLVRSALVCSAARRPPPPFWLRCLWCSVLRSALCLLRSGGGARSRKRIALRSRGKTLRPMKCPSSDRLHNGCHATLQRNLGEDVGPNSKYSAGVGQLGASAGRRHHPDELKDLLRRARRSAGCSGSAGYRCRLGQQCPVQRAQRGVNPVEVAALVRN